MPTNTGSMTPVRHAPFSPSSAKQWLNCPAWFALTRGAKRTTNAAADAGTMIHDLAAKILTGKTVLDQTAMDALGETGMAYVNYIRSLPLRLDVEKEIVSDPNLLFGTPDAMGVRWTDISQGTLPDELIVVDLKTGHEDVSPVENPQLMVYAGMAFAERGREGGPHVMSARLVIVQDGKVKDWSCDAVTVRKFFIRAWEAIRANLDGGSPKSGPHCKYCKGKYQCPAWAEENQALTKQARETLDLTILTGDALAEILDKAEGVETFIKACREEALARGGAGWYAVERGEARRTWAEDLVDAKAELLAMGVDPMETSMIGLGEAKKRIKARLKCTAKEADEIIDKLTVKATGSLKLVRQEKQPAGDNAILFAQEEVGHG